MFYIFQHILWFSQTGMIRDRLDEGVNMVSWHTVAQKFADMVHFSVLTGRGPDVAHLHNAPN